MEQLISTMLANPQIPQAAPAAKKDGSSAQKDGFQKLLEQKQTDAPQASRPEKTDASQKPQESQGAQEAQETEGQPQTALKSGRELEEQMVLAAMAAMQVPVTPVEQAAAPEVQAEAAVDGTAPLAAETLLTPEERSFAPEAEVRTAEIPVEEGGSETVGQAPAEEIPQAIEAPEAPRDTQERTVEVKVERGEDGARDAEAAADKEETPDFQAAEAETPVFEDVKAVPVKVGEAPKAAEAEEPVEKQIAPKLTEALRNGETRVELQLTPENLGKVTVEMTWSRDGGLVVQLHAENRGTQELLSKNTAGLEQLLGREAQQEVRVEVPRQEESQRQDLYEQQQEHHQRRQQEQRQKHEARSEDFLQQLRLGLIPLDGE